MKPEDVVRQKFSRAFLGYDVREVDEFLDEIIRALEACQHEKELDTVRIRTLITELERRAGRPAAAAVRSELPGMPAISRPVPVQVQNAGPASMPASAPAPCPAAPSATHPDRQSPPLSYPPETAHPQPGKDGV